MTVFLHDIVDQGFLRESVDERDFDTALPQPMSSAVRISMDPAPPRDHLVSLHLDGAIFAGYGRAG
jgi:hypothetical protein